MDRSRCSSSTCDLRPRDQLLLQTTTRDAHGRDYEVLFAADAVEGPDLEDAEGQPVPHDAVLASTLTALGAGFAEIVTPDEVVERLA